jgi:hypothetical protein
MNKKHFHCIVTALLLITSATALSQPQMYDIVNFNGENKTALYGDQTSSILWCLKGDVKFKESIKLKYSTNSTVDADSLEQKGILFRKVMPKDYWSQGVGATRLDTKPNEDGHIWFERIFAEEDAKGDIKVFAAYKVMFEGTNSEQERMHPRIKDIIVILDKKELGECEADIKKLMAANNMQLPPPQKKKPKTSKNEKPPEVDKLEN